MDNQHHTGGMTIRPNGLLLPGSALGAIIDDVARYGREEVETGGFLLAATGTDAIAVVARAGTKGISRGPGLFQVCELALDALFTHADEHQLWIPAMYHSHHSVPELVSVIVPFFSHPPSDTSRWGWWRFEREWVPIAPPSPSDVDVRTIVFDEDGARAC